MISGTTPADWVAYHAARRPDAAALRWESGTMDWRDLHRAVRQWTTHFHALGIEPGDRIMVALPNSPEFLVAFAATARVGAIFVPVDPHDTSDRLAQRIEHTSPGVLVTSRDLPTALTDSGAPKIVSLSLDGDERRPAVPTNRPNLDAVPDHNPEMNDDALIIFSSGTTGEPTAAVHTWESIHWNHRQFIDALGLTRKDTYLGVAPMHHIAGLHTFAGPLLYVGGTIRTATSFEPGRCAARINDGPVTCTFMVPTMWRRVLEHPALESVSHQDFRLGLVGGAPTTSSLIESARQAGIHLVEGYGMTEAGPMVSLLDANDPSEHDGGIGRAGLHVRVRVVDEQGNSVVDEPGELQVHAPNLMSRYWKAPEKTERSFDGEWFRTGDVVRVRSDGTLQFEGRRDDMFVSGGENIYPGPIERALETSQKIEAAAVVGTDSDLWGETVTAVIEPAPGCQPSLKECRAVTDSLAHFRRPRRLIRLDSLPRTDTGKIRRDALRHRINEGDLRIDEERDPEQAHHD